MKMLILKLNIYSEIFSKDISINPVIQKEKHFFLILEQSNSSSNPFDFNKNDIVIC